MLKKANVNEVMVQADYMSGDRNTIASALRVRPKLGIVVITAKGHDKAGLELYNFYKSATNVNRVERYSLNLPTDATAEIAKEKVRAAYKEVETWYYSKTKKKTPPPAWMSGGVEAGIDIYLASYGTQVVANAFTQNSNAARSSLQAYWRLPESALEPIRTEVANWLTGKGFRQNRAYIFLFAKEGDRRAEKAHHFTSILTWRILQERIEHETTLIPVACGEDIGLRTNPRLVKFWDDPAWKKIVEGRSIDPRSAQLGMWCYLAEHFKGVSIIGMRSGMIEVPALLGIRTLFLEEKHNGQAKRMEKWLNGVVPGFQRQVVNTPPGIKQQIYWKEASLKAPTHTPVNKHATAQGGHVADLVMGFESKKGDTQYKGKQFDLPKPPEGRSLAAKQPETLASGKIDTGLEGDKSLASAVFGSGGLAKIIPAEKFKLQSTEFDDILAWVKNTPKPIGATGAVPGYVDGHLQKKDEALTEASTAKSIKKWSEYFASDEYRKKIGADTPLDLID